MKSLSRILALSLIGCLLAGPAFAMPEGLGLSATQWETVKKGDLVIRLQDTKTSTLKDVLIVGRVDAGMEAAWDAITDYENFTKIYDKILKSETRFKEGLVEHHYSLLDYPWPFADRWTVNRIEHAPDKRSIKWHRIDGTLKELVGSWKLFPDGNDTILSYSVRVDPGIPLIPTWVIDWGTQQVAPEVIQSVRRHLKRKKS